MCQPEARRIAGVHSVVGERTLVWASVGMSPEESCPAAALMYGPISVPHGCGAWFSGRRRGRNRRSALGERCLLRRREPRLSGTRKSSPGHQLDEAGGGLQDRSGSFGACRSLHRCWQQPAWTSGRREHGEPASRERSPASHQPRRLADRSYRRALTATTVSGGQRARMSPERAELSRS